MDLKKIIQTIPDFPKPGIQFRDITTLIKDPEAFSFVIDSLASRYKNIPFDFIAGIESRGFIFGSALAHKMGVGFIPVRKAGKLPGKIVSMEYELEYGTDKIEIHSDAVRPGDKVLLIDDLIATGGTAQATAKLIEKVGGHIVEIAFVIDLPDLKGKEKLKNYAVYTMVEFEGD